MSNGNDAFKTYNERIKTFETLAKREAELIDKLSQSDSEKDIERKINWAKELHSLLEATKRLLDGRSDQYANLM